MTFAARTLARLERLADGAGVRIGAGWRAVEGPWPNELGPIVLQFQTFRDGAWTTVFTLDPDAAIGVATGAEGPPGPEGPAGPSGGDIPVYTSATRPAASVDAPKLIIVRDVGSPDALFSCLRNSDGTFSWAYVTIAGG